MLVIAAIIYALAPIARAMNGFRAMPTGGARPLAWATATLGGASALGLAAAAQATHAAEPRLFVAGLVGWAEPFAYGALTAAALAVALCYLSIKARIVEPLPVGVTLGLALTAVSALAFGAFTAVWVVAPL